MSAAVKKANKKENLNDILKDIAKLDAKKSKEQQANNNASQSANNSAQSIVQQQTTPPARKKKNWPKTQTSPEPTVPIQYLFSPLTVNKTTKVATGGFPVGELMPYTKGSKAKPAPVGDDQVQQQVEKLVNVTEDNMLFEQELQKARKAAECHRTVRKWVQSWLKPGLKLVDICERTENKIRELIENDSLQGGIAFPIGCSINNCAAHFNPNPGDQTVLQQDDVLKIDIGIHEQGRIIDSAFTMCWNPKFQPLLDAVRETTNAGIKAAGVDVLLSEVGATIQEVMESHEVELNGKVYRVKPIRNLCGHSIDPYHIHAGKTVPCVAEKNFKNKSNARMEAHEFYAIETFGSIAGQGYVDEQGENSHFAKDFDAPPASVLQHQLKSKAAKELLQTIEAKFGTLAWCPRYLERFTGQWNKLALATLCRAGIVNQYPPLYDVPGSYVAQFEHTFVLRETCKEVLSRGDDY